MFTSGCHNHCADLYTGLHCSSAVDWQYGCLGMIVFFAAIMLKEVYAWLGCLNCRSCICIVTVDVGVASGCGRERLLTVHMLDLQFPFELPFTHLLHCPVVAAACAMRRCCLRHILQL